MSAGFPRLLLGRIGPFLLAGVLVIALQQVLTRNGIEFYMTQITLAACYALVVIGLCLLMGYAGQVSLGHAGFFAIGGYTAAALTTMNLYQYRDSSLVAMFRSLGMLAEGTDLYGQSTLHTGSVPALAAAVLLAVLIALLIGLPVLRLKGHYLAMATLGFGLIVYRVVLGTPGLGQADGISSVPPLLLWGDLQLNSRKAFRVESYYIAWSVVLVAMLLATNLVHSRVGRALRAIHENEQAAHSLGVNTYRYKLMVFAISAALAAIGGSMAAHFKGSIGPSEATTMYSVRYVAIVAVGGMANLWGGLLMAMVLTFLSLRGAFGRYDDLVFGAILVFMMLFAPAGLGSAARTLWRAVARWRRPKKAAAPEVQHVR